MCIRDSLCTSHPGRIQALHDFHIQALAYRPVSFVSTIPVSSHMKTRFQAHAEDVYKRQVYFFVQATELIKVAIGYFMVHSNVWLVQMV